MTDPGTVEELLKGLVIRPYRPGDERAILETFHRVFPWANRSVEEWNWEFKDSPLGVHAFLGVIPDGRVISQFAGIPRRVKVGDGERCFAEMVDSFTDPEFRRGLKKPGVFGKTVYDYVDHYGRPDRETVMYGLPNPPAYRIGSLLFGYTHLHHVEAATRPVKDPAGVPAPDLKGGIVREIRGIPADYDSLWNRVRSEYDIIVERDRTYLAWRYLNRPGGTYRLYEQRDARGALIGLFVLKDRWIEGEIKKNATAVADWVVDRRHPDTKAAPAAIARLAHEAGAEEAWFVFRPQCAEWNHLIEIGWSPQPTPFRWVARTYDRDVVPIERMRDGWFITLGDFDVI